jgi:hypothetical protein
MGVGVGPLGVAVGSKIGGWPGVAETSTTSSSSESQDASKAAVIITITAKISLMVGRNIRLFAQRICQ